MTGQSDENHAFRCPPHTRHAPGNLYPPNPCHQPGSQENKVLSSFFFFLHLEKLRSENFHEAGKINFF